jgi:hypothetical protein
MCLIAGGQDGLSGRDRECGTFGWLPAGWPPAVGRVVAEVGLNVPGDWEAVVGGEPSARGPCGRRAIEVRSSNSGSGLDGCKSGNPAGVYCDMARSRVWWWVEVRGKKATEVEGLAEGQRGVGNVHLACARRIGGRATGPEGGA